MRHDIARFLCLSDWAMCQSDYVLNERASAHEPVNGFFWDLAIADFKFINADFCVPTGDTKFYVLGMGGGGPEENISGTVNGVNMTSASVSILMSQDIKSFQTGYNDSAGANGTFNVNLADVSKGIFPGELGRS